MEKISFNIPKNIKKFRIDVGTSSTAPNSAFWLNKYKDIAVFGIEPNPYNYQRICDGGYVQGDIQIISNDGIVSKNGVTLSNYISDGNYFKGFEIAIDNVDEICSKKFYCTNELNTGCSSLHKPIDELLNGVQTEKEIEVDVVPLFKILDKFPFEQIPVIEFLKTDTQANDLNVIKSCRDYIKKVCFVFSEYYAHSAYEGEKDMVSCFNEFNDYMQKNGFKLFYVSGTDVAYVNSNLMEYIITNGVLNDCIEFQNGHNFL